MLSFFGGTKPFTMFRDNECDGEEASELLTRLFTSLFPFISHHRNSTLDLTHLPNLQRWKRWAKCFALGKIAFLNGKRLLKNFQFPDPKAHLQKGHKCLRAERHGLMLLPTCMFLLYGK